MDSDALISSLQDQTANFSILYKPSNHPATHEAIKLRSSKSECSHNHPVFPVADITNQSQHLAHNGLSMESIKAIAGLHKEIPPSSLKSNPFILWVNEFLSCQLFMTILQGRAEIVHYLIFSTTVFPRGKNVTPNSAQVWLGAEPSTRGLLHPALPSFHLLWPIPQTDSF